MCFRSRSKLSDWLRLWCFHRSSLSQSKVIAEKLLVTFHDLKWPWRHQEGSLVAIFRFMVSIISVTRCLWVFGIVFVQKRRLSILSHCLIMERSQIWRLTWPWITDIKIPRYTFIDVVTILITVSKNVLRWLVIWYSYDEHSNFFWGEVTWLDLVTWIWVTGFWNLRNMCGKDVWQLCARSSMYCGSDTV